MNNVSPPLIGKTLFVRSINCKYIPQLRKVEHNDFPKNKNRHIKLEKSKQLLKHTELNISEIAYAVGFKDPSYFSRLFSEKYGISPSQY